MREWFFSFFLLEFFRFSFFCFSPVLTDLSLSLCSLVLSSLAPTMAPAPPNLNRQVFKVSQRVLVPYTDKYYEAKVRKMVF